MLSCHDSAMARKNAESLKFEKVEKVKNLNFIQRMIVLWTKKIMKKILLSLVLVGFLAVLAMPVMVSAVSPIDGCTLKHTISDVTGCTKDANVSSEVKTVGGVIYTKVDAWGMCCVIDGIYKITDWIFLLFISLVVIFVLIGAYEIITAGGDAKKVETGRGYILYALIGLVVAVFAKAVPTMVLALIS